MKCPTCGTNGVPVFQCDKCGDTRCSSTSIKACGGPKGPTGAVRAMANHQCKSCGKGKYKKIG